MRSIARSLVVAGAVVLPLVAQRPATDDAPAANARAATSRPAKVRAKADPEAAYVRTAGRGAEERLETAWSVLRDASGAEVWLVGAVHVADAEYFAALNTLLGAADLVLYEGVGGEPTADLTTIARLQLALGRVLDLAFQKDGVVYGRPHFQRADLDLPEIERLLAERGERLLPGGDVLKAFGPLLATLLESAAREAEKLRARGSAAPFGAVKARVARLLADPNAITSATSRGWDEVVIGERNRHALDVYDATRGAEPRRVAIFYGAAHLPDFERRLAAKGFARVAKDWLPAWRLGPKAPPPVAAPPMPARAPI